jgi:tetratricopeptide (TPR) repeat protein
MFKSSSRLFDDANDLFKQGNFARAQGRYEDAAAKFQKEGDQQSARLAGAYAAFVSLATLGPNPSAYMAAAESLQQLGNVSLKLGVREFPAPALATEVALVAAELSALMMPRGSVTEQTFRAQKLKEVGIAFQTRIGGNVIVVKELFQKESTTGFLQAFQMFALSEEMQGEAAVFSDPKTAGEHYQQASLYWNQAHLADAANAALAHSREYQRSAKCWFCGREVTGQGISFFPLPSQLTLALTKGESASVLPTFDPGTNQVFACRGCNTTINALADSWALKRASEVYVKLEAEIEAIREQLRQQGQR